MRRVLKGLLLVVAIIYFIIGLAALGVRYVIAPHIDAFRPRIEALASRALGAPVSIGRLSASWQGLSPTLDVDALKITPGLSVEHLHAVVAWRSLLHGQPVFEQLQIDAPDLLAQRDAQGHLSIAGVTLRRRGGHPYAFMDWLLEQGTVVLRQGTLHWRDQTRAAPPATLRGLQLVVRNSLTSHEIGLQGHGDDGTVGALDVRARFNHALLSERGNPMHWTGRAYLSINAADLTAIGAYLPVGKLQPAQGHVGAQAWLSFADGHASDAHGSIQGNAIVLAIDDKLQRLELPSLAAQWSLNQRSNDYRISLHDLSMEIAGQAPLQDGTPVLRVLHIGRFDGRYRAAAPGRGEIIAASGDIVDLGLLAEIGGSLPLPARVATRLALLDPRGVLTNYQLDFERAAPPPDASAATIRASANAGSAPLIRYRIAARFDHAGLAAQQPPPGLTAAGHPRAGAPGFDNMSGRIDADESKGALTLDAQNAGVTIRGLFDEPRLAFDALRGQASWHIGGLDAAAGSASATATATAASVASSAAASATPTVSTTAASASVATVAPLARAPAPTITSATLADASAAAQAAASTSVAVPVATALSRVPGQFIHVDSAKFAFSNADANGTLAVGFHGPFADLRAGRLDLNAVLDSMQVARVPRYLPTSISPKIRAYLGHALLAGQGRHGTLQIHGPLNEFPFNRHPDTGVFRIAAPFTGARFDPSPYPPLRLIDGSVQHWPTVNAISGHFDLDGPHLGFDVTHGEYKRVVLSGVQGRIQNLADRQEGMVIRGAANGPLADMLDYGNGGPLPVWTGHASERLHATGNAALSLTLKVPRRPPAPLNAPPTVPVKRAQFDGALAFDGNTLTYDKAPPISELHGRLNFGPHRFALQDVKGRFLGGPLSVTGGLHPDGSASVAGNGRLTAAGLQDFIGSASAVAPFMHRLSGELAYALNVDAHSHAPPQITLRSDLVGLGSALPAPLDKAAAASMPLNLSVTSPQPPDEPAPVADVLPGSRSPSAAGPKVKPPQHIVLTLGPIAADFVRGGGTVPPTIAGAIGVNHPAVAPAHGIVANVMLDTFDADAWRALVAQAARSAQAGANNPNATPASPSASASASASAMAANSTAPSDTEAAPASASIASLAAAQKFRLSPALLPSAVDIRIGTLTLLSRRWDGVALTAAQQNSQWQAHLDSAQVAGDIDWRPAHVAANGAPSGGALQAHFSRVNVPDAPPDASKVYPPHSVTLPTEPPLGLPSLDIAIDRLSIGKRDLGQIGLHAYNAENAGVAALIVDPLTLDSPAAHLNFSGSWRASQNVAADAPTTSVSFKADIVDAGKLIQQLGFPRSLQRGAGSVSGNLDWRGAPAAIDYSSLNGKLLLDLRRGQILKAEPAIGKLIGLLSLQTLGRLLMLDFSGVFGAGLPFDRVHGTADVTAGVVRSDDFELTGPAAHATVRGEADLVRNREDLLITAIPHINAGSASLAAAIVNPLIGLGSLVAQLVLSESLARRFALRYHVTGTLSSPHIERLKGNRGNMDPPSNPPQSGVPAGASDSISTVTP